MATLEVYPNQQQSFEALTLLGNQQLIDLSPDHDRLFAARHGFADGLETHALSRKLLEFLDLAMSPCLAMTLKTFCHDKP